MSSFESLPPLPVVSNAREEGSARIGQLLDESDHKRCSEGNKNALLAETLDRLRSLTNDIKDDDWMLSGIAGDSQNGGIPVGGDDGCGGTGMTSLPIIR
mmetsp:Transcript_36901/g.53936  ORF Transcript_36901/g.53936 Transcript_36901/m.53936 type:complete len:99 (-) Transcript_36901:558-854(-)